MEKFDNFYISKPKFNLKTLKAEFNYSFDKKRFFTEEIDFFCDWFLVFRELKQNEIEIILYHISLSIGISYYKLSLTQNIIIEDFKLSEEQEIFWKKFYINWLWEYLYVNKLSIKDRFNFKYQSKNELKKINFEVWKKALVPIGWWKDSILTLEIFKKAWIDFNTFTFWKDYDLHSLFSEKVENKRIIIKRRISDELFKMNSEWYYNWHVPITWIISFISVLMSYLYGFKYVAFSNEKSANFWNTIYEWFEINHQWSKSLDFELDFSEYINQNLSKNYKYFSFLRWFYEIKIAKEISEFKHYFWNFSSCNNNFKIIEWNKKTSKLWCLNCPKCAFVYSILRPFINEKEVEKIFLGDMYLDKKNENVFKELLWISNIKPFECVWTNEEVIIWMYKSLDKYEEIPYILEMFIDEVLSKMNQEELQQIEEKLFKIDSENNIPEELKQLIK